MNPHFVQAGTAMRRRPRRTGGFSLLELMIAVGLLTVIIIALYAMFDQTQKAFRQSLNQADLSEGGRSALDLMHNHNVMHAGGHFGCVGTGGKVGAADDDEIGRAHV